MKDCMTGKAKAGKIDKDKAAAAGRVFDENMSALGDESAAAKATLEQLGIDAAVRKRQQLLQVQAQRRLHDGIMGAAKKADAAIGAFDSTGVKDAPFLSATQVRKTVLGNTHRKVTDLIAHHKRNLIGQTRDKAGVLDIVREAFGEATNNGNARAFAKAWQEASEALRTRFNAAGGHIGKHERWGLPTHWNSVKMRVGGVDDFVKDMLPRLDWEKMELRTGKAFPEGAREQVLRDVHETISTDGWSRRDPGEQGGARSVANRRADHRFMEFKTADDWIAMMDKYGNGDAFSVMMAHMDGMARDIGAMEVLGPNPRATVRFLQDTLRKEANESKTLSERQRNRLKTVSAHLETLYDHYSGAANAPVDEMMARGGSSLRGFLTAALLGAAQLSAVGDVVFHNITARFNGLPSARMLGRFIKLFSAVSREDQKFAVRAGLIAENWSQIATAQMRFIGEIPTAQWAQTLSDGVLRASGLSHWTQAGRWAFGLEYMGHLADNVGKAFDDLSPELRRAFGAYNISAADWDKIRATGLTDHNGATFLVPGDVVDEAVGTKLLAMIQSEIEHAVPSFSLRGGAAVGGGIRPGTIAGEGIRSGLMFKSFAITMYHTHLKRAMTLPTHAAKVNYLAQLVVGTTLMGALSVQLKDISKGREPRAMDSLAFWKAAMLQGGGLGIFGDFVFADQNRLGQGLPTTLAGPVAGFLGDALGLIHKGVTLDEGFGGEAAKFAGRYTPGSSLWYGRLLFERYVLDQMQKMIDPSHKKRWAGQEGAIKRNMDTKFFWPRGELSP